MELISLYELAEANNIRVDCYDLAENKSITIEDKNEFFVAINPFVLTSHQNEKMVLAHELGHCCTGSIYIRSASEVDRLKAEYWADKWIVKTLVPAAALMDAIHAGYTEVWDLAERFDVSEDLVRRAFDIYRRSGEL